MSEKTTTTQTQDTSQFAQFDPASMGTFTKLQPLLGGYFGDILAPGPITKTPFFQGLFQQGSRAASQLGGRGMENVMANMRAGGFAGSNMPGVMHALLRQAGGATSALQSNAFWNALFGAESRKGQAAQLAAGFQPLQIGQKGTMSGKTVQKKSGLGTWLPKVAAAAISAGLAPFTGGASLLGMPGALRAGSFLPSGGTVMPTEDSPFFQNF